MLLLVIFKVIYTRMSIDLIVFFILQTLSRKILFTLDLEEIEVALILKLKLFCIFLPFETIFFIAVLRCEAIKILQKVCHITIPKKILLILGFAVHTQLHLRDFEKV